MSLAICTKVLSKRYDIARSRAESPKSLREAMQLSRIFAARRSKSEEFWALKDVDLSISEGTVLGIIGKNGAGKSTLLKLLSRITEPSSGRIELYGNVGALLEVGTGFHPELTGRENVFLNGAILGMSRKEIRSQFDSIVDFAGVSRFIDTPVKRYSSGMYVRLAFAVAAHLRSDILIVDEVLAVGDSEFQKRCLGKMQSVANSGRTVIFVSHQMDAIQSLCTEVVLLKSGQIDYQGAVSEGVQRYLENGATADFGRLSLASHVNRGSSFDCWIEEVEMRNGNNQVTSCFASGSPLSLDVRIRPRHPIKNPRIAVAIEDQYGRRLGTTANYFYETSGRVFSSPFSARVTIDNVAFAPGQYFLSFSLADNAVELLDSVDNAGTFHVEWIDGYPSGEPYQSVYGPLILNGCWLLS